MNKLFSENFSTQPFWQQITTAMPKHDSNVELPDHTDTLVIGGGYTGLHVALALARAGRQVVVLEKVTLDGACSSRNGGQISDESKPSLAALTKRHGEGLAREILGEGVSAASWLGRFISEEKIECDYRQCGSFHGAHSSRHFKQQCQQVAALDNYNDPALPGYGATVVEPHEVAQEIGTSAYHGGVVYPTHASLQPAKYHRQLANLAINSGALLKQNCAVESVQRVEPGRGGGYLVRSLAGELRAKNVVVATNGYTDNVVPKIQRRVIPIGSYIIATESMPIEIMQSCIPRHRIASDTRQVVYYYRLSPDKSRMVFGGRVSHNEVDPTLSAGKLHREMTRLFPQLKSARIDSSWMGYVGFTFDHMSHTGTVDGDLESGIHYSLGYCGSGIALSSYLGMKLGLRLSGDSGGDTALQGLSFPTRPFYQGKPWFLGPAVAFKKLQDRF